MQRAEVGQTDPSPVDTFLVNNNKMHPSSLKTSPPPSTRFFESLNQISVQNRVHNFIYRFFVPFEAQAKTDLL